MFTIVTGNPIDGVTLHGLFATAQDAVQDGARYYDDDWWIAEIHPTDEELANKIVVILKENK